MPHRFALIIPALNEQESIGELLRRLPRGALDQILVVDNGSCDRTGDIARAAGAQVVLEPRRGYGRACQAGLAKLRQEITAVAFMDADLSDDPDDFVSLLRTFDKGAWDLVIGSRVLGHPEPGSLTLVQQFGNWLTTRLVRWIWGEQFSDLGPLRVVSRQALGRLHLQDRDYGWNIEMQAKAARLKLRVCEVPVRYRRRRFGRSKISGTVVGSVRAGAKILWTLLRCWISPLPAKPEP